VWIKERQISSWFRVTSEGCRRPLLGNVRLKFRLLSWRACESRCADRGWMDWNPKFPEHTSVYPRHLCVSLSRPHALRNGTFLCPCCRTSFVRSFTPESSKRNLGCLRITNRPTVLMLSSPVHIKSLPWSCVPYKLIRSCLSNEEFLSILWDQKVCYHVQNSPVMSYPKSHESGPHSPIVKQFKY
jgi:hypothetical protein